MLKIFKYPGLRKKIFVTLLIVLIVRFFAHIPIPGVDIASIRAFLSSSSFFGLFDLLSGGGFTNFSLITLGIGPYINVSIILQLLSTVIPSLEALQKEGDYGREKINMYNKLLTIPVSFLQGYGIYFYLSRQGVIGSLDALGLVVFLLTLTAGSFLMVWLGDLGTEYGLGNGISLLVLVSVLSRLPASFYTFGQTVFTLDFAKILPVAIFMLIALLIIACVVYVNEGVRNIPIEYGRRFQANSKVENFLPLKVNQAGVIPIIFAVSLVSLPSAISAPLLASANVRISSIGLFLARYFGLNSIGYNIMYFLLVIGLTYLYTFIQFNPKKLSDDIKKRGGFIPGIRPGLATERYLKSVLQKITLFGGIFLALIAVLPFLIQNSLSVTGFVIGGTSILLTVSIVLDTVRQAKSLMVTSSYDRFIA